MSMSLTKGQLPVNIEQPERTGKIWDARKNVFVVTSVNLASRSRKCTKDDAILQPVRCDIMSLVLLMQ